MQGTEDPALGRSSQQLASDRSLSQIVAEAKEAAKARAAAFHWDPFGVGATTGAAFAPDPPPCRGPLNVVLADVGKTLFQAVRDPRLTISRLTDKRSEAPDVLVLDGNHAMRAAQSATIVPDELWRRIAHGDTTLVLDASGEGRPHHPVPTNAFHEFLRSKGVARTQAAYITQDRGYDAEYGAYCEALGEGGNRMPVWIYDRYIQETFAPFHEVGELHFERRLERYVGAGRTRPRRFICLNNLMRPARALLLLRLLQQGLWDQGFISMGRIGANGQTHTAKPGFISLSDGRESEPARQAFISLLRSPTGLESLCDELLPFLDELIGRAGPYLGVNTSISEKKQRHARIQASALEECAHSWFTIVTESDFSDRFHRITEKPFKPLLDFHPFIILGSVGSLRLIRAYGFDTYPDLFDEGYDDQPDPRTRFDMVFDQVARLCRMGEAEIAELDTAASATAVFNAWWGLVELPRLFRSHIDAPLVDRLLALSIVGRPGGA